MKLGTVDLNQLRGVGDKFVGLSKELLGTLFGSESLQREGEAQQERATEELKAAREQLKAQGHQAKAEGFEAKQKAAQRAKEAS